MTVDRHTLRSGGCLKRFLAVTAAMALAGSGIVATSVVAQADPEPPATLMSSGLNPMGAATPTGSKDRYTVFVKDNAHFANAETEGSIAVGGVATFDKNAGIYPLVHQAAGNEDYSLPTLDGAPNRLLLQEFGAYSNSEVKLEERNSPHEGIVGSAKIFHQSAPEDFSVQEKSNSPTFAETGTVQGVPQVWASGYPYSETAMDVAAHSGRINSKSGLEQAGDPVGALLIGPGRAEGQRGHLATCRHMSAMISGVVSEIQAPAPDSEPARYFSLPGPRIT